MRIKYLIIKKITMYLLNYIKKEFFFAHRNNKRGTYIFIISLVILIFSSFTLKGQEYGPLLMKQELGYTLGGSVLGAGLGVIVWFMDPLNPSITLKSTVQNGFVAGTALGALFGFYMIQNAIVVPQENMLPENIDQLLGINEYIKPLHKSIMTRGKNIDYNSLILEIFNFRF